MSTTPPSKSVEEITVQIARVVLQRSNATERDGLASTRTLATWLGATRGTVREALQRLIALGLVHVSNRHQAVMPPVNRKLSGDGLVLMVRAAANVRGQRRNALLHLLETTRFALSESFERAARGEGLNQLRLEADVRAMVKLLADPKASERAARALFSLTWFASEASGELALRLLGAAVDRAYAWMLPWLQAAIRVPDDHLRWGLVLEAFERRDGDATRLRVLEAWREYQQRVLRLAEYDEPEKVLLHDLEQDDLPPGPGPKAPDSDPDDGIPF